MIIENIKHTSYNLANYSKQPCSIDTPIGTINIRGKVL